MRRPDITKIPLYEMRYALLAAAILQRMTGDSCSALWEDTSKYMILRQTPEGKMVNG